MGDGGGVEGCVGRASLGDRCSLQKFPSQHSNTSVLVLRTPEQTSGELKSVRRQPRSRLILPFDSSLILAKHILTSSGSVQVHPSHGQSLIHKSSLHLHCNAGCMRVCTCMCVRAIIITVTFSLDTYYECYIYNEAKFQVNSSVSL